MELTPQEEAAMLCYIAIYYNCDTSKIGEIIQKHGSTTSRVVYRGQSKKDTVIDTRSPFVSTSPDKGMAESFVEHDWESSQKVGNLFTIHLVNAKWLSTRSITFTLTDKVKEEVRTMIGNNMIRKDKDYTLDQYWPQIKERLTELLADGEEILVLTNGTFYSDESMKTKGFKTTIPNQFETWYSGARGGRRRKTRRRHK